MEMRAKLAMFFENINDSHDICCPKFTCDISAS